MSLTGFRKYGLVFRNLAFLSRISHFFYLASRIFLSRISHFLSRISHFYVAFTFRNFFFFSTKLHLECPLQASVSTFRSTSHSGEICETGQGTYIISFDRYIHPLYCNIKFSQTLEESKKLPYSQS